MNKATLVLPLIALVALSLQPIDLAAQNQPPQISNIATVHNASAGTVTITYDLADAENDDVEILLKASADSGTTYLANTSNVSGDVGYPVTPGPGLQIEWDYNDTISNIMTYRIKLVADDRYQMNIQDIVDQVDSNRLKQNMEVVAQKRHRNNNLAPLNDIKDTIEQRFVNYGLQTMRQEFSYQGYTAHNISGRLQGHGDEEATYIIDAHLDAVANTPGADDNASGVAGFLEAARILSQYNFDHSIRIIGFDLEEAGLIGSNAYVNNGGIQPYESIAGVYNYEMIGFYSEENNSQSLPANFEFAFPNAYAQVEEDTFKGNFITNVANGNADSLWMSFDSAAAWYVPDLKVVTVASAQVTSVPDLRRSDHASFWDAGYDALMITDGADFRNPNYHQSSDTIGTIDFRFMANVVKATVGAVCHRAGIQHSTTATAYIEESTGLEDPKSLKADFQLFPNPAENLVRIKPTGYDGPIQLRVMDNTGKVVMRMVENTSSSGLIELDLKSLPVGLYHLELGNDDHQSRKKLMVK